MKAYKVFDADWSCRGFKFEVGKTYTIKGKLELCKNGFHCCIKLSNCFNYYSFDSNNKVAEVELLGDVVGMDGDKQATNKIKIVRELNWNEVLTLCNSGHRNSGHRNSGHWNSGNRNSGHWNSGNSNSGDSNSGDSNSGHRNSGHWNSGDRNSGHWNSGHWNSGDRNSGHWNSGHWNSGHFNTNTPALRIFNKTTKKTDVEFPSWFYFDLTSFISYDTATDDERIKYKKEIEVCGGFLKTLSYKEAWKKAFDNASEEERQKVKKLPNYNADIFEEITGLRIE